VVCPITSKPFLFVGLLLRQLSQDDKTELITLNCCGVGNTLQSTTTTMKPEFVDVVLQEARELELHTLRAVDTIGATVGVCEWGSKKQNLWLEL
jgi:hypothetical protein